MKIKVLMYALALSCGLSAVSANAATLEKRAEKPFADADHVVYSLAGDKLPLPLKSKLSNHGGVVLSNPKVVFLFWGPSFNNAASPDYSYARTLQAYRDWLGTSSCWPGIQGCGTGTFSSTNLGGGTADWFDTTTPPTNVTDATVQSEVSRYLASHTYNSSTIYEVVIPSGHYSSSGSSTSCGGPSLAYCAYHGNFSSSGRSVIYAIQPYPSCSGCKVSGWTDVQNEEHFVFVETVDAASNPVNGWWDNTTGQECAEKCAWSPPPFLVNGYACGYVWSNAANACVKPQ